MYLQIDRIQTNRVEENTERKYIDAVAFQRKYELTLTQAHDIIRRMLTVQGYEYPNEKRGYEHKRVIVLDFDQDKGNHVWFLDMDPNSAIKHEHEFFVFSQRIDVHMSLEAHFTCTAVPHSGFVTINGKKYEINQVRRMMKLMDEEGLPPEE